MEPFLDPLSLAHCLHVMDLASLYISFPDGYPTDVEQRLDEAELVLANKLWEMVDQDVSAFLAAMHDGTRAAWAMSGQEFADKALECVGLAGRY